MRDRITTIGPIAAMAGAIGLCCGLPVLLSLGIAGAIAGWSLQSWVLIWARARRCPDGHGGSEAGDAIVRAIARDRPCTRTPHPHRTLTAPPT